MIGLNVFLGIILWNLVMASLGYKNKWKSSRLYCGMVGYSGKEEFDPSLIKTLILWNSFERGEDATGLYSPKNGLKKSILKGSEFVINPNFEIIPDTILMAHVRAKTVGVNSISNAHPFSRGNYLLQHNGTLKNHYDLLRKYKLAYKDYDVDSDILAGCIAASENFTPLKEIDGAAAVIIHDRTHENRLYVFKNADRPLFKGYIGANMYMSSLREPLILIGCVNIKEFKDDRLYIIENGSIIDHRPVKNTPYKEPVTYSNNTYVTGSNYRHPNFKAKGSWVRSSVSMSIKGDSKPYFKLTKGEYYYIDEVPEATRFKVYDSDSNKTCEVYASCMDLYDIPKVGDYFEVISDIYSKHNKTNLSAKKGDVIVSTFVWEDTEMSGKDTITGAFVTQFEKSLVRKMTYDEVEQYKATLFSVVGLPEVKQSIGPELFQDSEEATVIPLNGKDIVVDAESSPFEKDGSDNSEEPENDDNQQDEDYFGRLDDYFAELEDKLEDLNEEINNSVMDIPIRNKVMNLIDSVVKARTAFIEDIEDKEEVNEEV